MRKLKSSLKLSRCNSLSSDLSSTSSVSTSSNKFVRFAPQLTTVKNFHINDKPISISNETSPILYPILNNNNIDNNNNNNVLLWDIDNDDLDDDLIWLNQKINNYNLTYAQDSLSSSTIENTMTTTSQQNDVYLFNKFNSLIQSTNFNLSSHDNKEVNLIKLYQSNNKIIGTIKCQNIAFEKFIKCKFTFNKWDNIHYINAYYVNSPCNHDDIFKFQIDLNDWKVFLQYNNLINEHGNIKLQFVIMYDVVGKTYYDNNNNNNFIIDLHLSPEIPLPVQSVKTEKLIRPTTTRKFSDDTDYYNESPLKHMFHTDTTWIHPKNQNKLTFFDKSGQSNDNSIKTPSLSSSYSDLSSESWDDTISPHNSIYNNFIINNSNDTLLFFDAMDESDNETITPQNNMDNDTSTITDETIKKSITFNYDYLSSLSTDPL